MRELIVTGDDFGVSVELNEAVETAHVRGILNTASLMVAGAAADDAIARAKRLPSLHVGLHLAVTRSPPVLPPHAIPAITHPVNGRLPENLVVAGVRLFFLPAVRRQLESEIRAQFETFATTGLVLDHVNVHNHMHLHPTVLGLILKLGRDYDLRAVRLPREPGMSVFLKPWVELIRYRLHRSGIMFNNWLFGMHDSGHMTRERVLRLLAGLPRGISEMHFHPATGSWTNMETGMAAYEHAEELEALISADTASALDHHGIHLVSFSDILQ